MESGEKGYAAGRRAAIIVNTVSLREPLFERIRPIGSGATGRVELVRLLEDWQDYASGTELALKTLDPAQGDLEEARLAFEAEAKAGLLINDPSLVRVLFQGESQGERFLLMEYVPGRTLRAVMLEGPLPEPLVRSVGRQLAGGLAAVHAAGLVHGDVKPENIRLNDEGRAVLLDLGFARPLGELEAGADMGSLAYLSPERARGGGPSQAADVFALGMVLYEMATGLHPFLHKGFDPRSVQFPGMQLPPGTISSTGEIFRRSLASQSTDAVIKALQRARFVPPSHLDLSLSPFFDLLTAEVLAPAAELRPSAKVISKRFQEAEAGAWWRARVDPRDVDRHALRSLHAGKHLAPVVGRDKELRSLTLALEDARQGRSSVALISGQAGCGKWRLVNDFALRARTSFAPPIYLYTRWSEMAEAQRAGSLLTLLARWLRLPQGSECGEREHKRLLELVDERSAQTLLGALSAECEDELAESATAALVNWLRALGEKQPILLFVDDVQSAGPVTLDAITELLDSLGGMNMLVILGIREDDSELEPSFERLLTRLRRGGGEQQPFIFHELKLGPLDFRAMCQFVDAIFDSSVPRDRLARVLLRRSQGNPGMATEILVDLVNDGRAYGQQVGNVERLFLNITPDELPLPKSLGRIVRERITQLKPMDRIWLERLAVAGGRIIPEYLMHAFPPTGRAEIDAMLARLVRMGWLEAHADRYRFARPALRKVLYNSLPEARRRRLHLAAARGLEAEAEGSDPHAGGPEALYQRAFHLRAAEEIEDLQSVALEFLRTHGHRVSARRRLTVARWALEAMDQSHFPHSQRDRRTKLRLELLETAADAADHLGRRDEGRQLLDFLVDLDLATSAYPAEGARIYLLHARHAAATGQHGLARSMLRNALELSVKSGSRSLISQSERRLSQINAEVGDFALAREGARRAIESATTLTQRGLAYLALGHHLILVDRLDQALQEVNKGISLFQESGHVSLGIAAYANLLKARIWRSLGRPGRALAMARRAVDLARRSGDRRLEAEARARMGGLLINLNQLEQAESELRDASLLAGEVEDRRGQTLARLWIGLLLWESYSPRAQTEIETGLRLAREVGYFRAEGFGLAVLARIQRAAGDLAAADRSSSASIKLLRRHGAELVDRVLAVGTRHLVLSELGKPAEADRILRGLRDRLTKNSFMIENPEMRQVRKHYTDELLAAVLSPNGPVIPRARSQG